jgi:hypothetical protein
MSCRFGSEQGRYTVVPWREDGFHTRPWDEDPPEDWEAYHEEAEESTWR